ncbi:MAG: histidine phosphatase family protein [Bacteroidales bacterium]|jgi:phosphohistidine phosphatase|nr:histidine phosphatase family protein [Bacteroidales bacterium]
MRTISFIRHAKSDQSVNLPDFERPLNQRGLNDAPIMGEIIKNEYSQPDLILSSPANRAKTTTELIAKAIDYPETEIVFVEDLYFADTETFFEIIHQIDDNFKQVFIVSHNPGTTYIINRISNTRLDHMPTCGIAEIAFDINHWNEIQDKSGVLKRFNTPKMHK